MPSVPNLSGGRRVAITNIAKRPLVFCLNSKESVHLAPGARSAALPEYEVANNADIKKLRDRALIDIAAEGDADRAASDKPAKTAPRDK